MANDQDPDAQALEKDIKGRAGKEGIMRRINWSIVPCVIFWIVIMLAGLFGFFYAIYVFVLLIGKAQGWQ